MKHVVTIQQLATGHGAFLNVRDLYPCGASGFDVWGVVVNAEADPIASVTALALARTASEVEPFGTFHLLSFDRLADFNAWLEKEVTRYDIVYLITPQGLLVVSTTITFGDPPTLPKTTPVPEEATDDAIAIRLRNRSERYLRLTAAEGEFPQQIIDTEKSLISQAAAAWLTRYPLPR